MVPEIHNKARNTIPLTFSWHLFKKQNKNARQSLAFSENLRRITSRLR
jgi:hypothetical protein